MLHRAVPNNNLTCTMSGIPTLIKHPTANYHHGATQAAVGAKARTPTNKAQELAGDKRFAYKQGKWYNKPRVPKKVTARKPATGKPRSKLISARYGSDTMTILSSLIRGQYVDPALRAKKEYITAQTLYTWISSHNYFKTSNVSAEKVYHFILKGDNTDPRGRYDVLFENAAMSFIVEIKTTQKTLADFKKTYKKHSSVSSSGVPDSKYARHMIQLAEMIRTRRDYLTQNGQMHTVSGTVLLIGSDNVVEEVPLDPAFDRDELFDSSTVDIFGIITRAKKFLAVDTGHVLSDLKGKIGAFKEIRPPIHSIGPQYVVSSADGQAHGVWIYSGLMPLHQQKQVKDVLDKFMFTSNHFYVV
jgi:hypothetical protein